MHKSILSIASLFTVFAASQLVHADSVAIRVVGPDNRPVANAPLVIYAYSAQQTWTRKTDAAGRIALKMAPLADKRFGDVFVGAPGFGLARVELDTAHPDTLIRLQKPKTVAGMVNDEQGRPVSGATVRIRDIEQMLGTSGEDSLVYQVPKEFQTTFTTRTDAQGRWSIGGLPPKKAVVVALDDPAYIYATRDVPLGASSPIQSPALTALPGATIAGRVQGEDGRPAAGVTVFTNVREAERALIRRQTAVTGADGTYRLASLATGNYEVQVADPTKKRVALALKSVSARVGQVTSAQPLVMIEGAVVQGTITDKATGKPFTDAYLDVSGPQGTYATFVQADARGNYRVRLVPGTSRFYIAGPAGYVRKNLDVTVANGEQKRLDITLSGGLTLSGTTVNDKGQPLGGVFLFVYLNSKQFGPDSHGSPPIGVTSDANGRWQAKGLAPGTITLAPEASWRILEPVRSFTFPTKQPIQVKVRPYASPR